MTTIDQGPLSVSSGQAARFPDPYDVETPAGAEGWQEMYPYYNHFLEVRREKDSARTWFRNGMHFPEPMPPFDIVTSDSAFMSTGVMNTRVFALPPALGLDVRVVNGYMYMSSLGVEDPAEIGRRAEEFAERVGHYYRNWPDLYAKWEIKVRDRIAALQEITIPELGDFEPIEHVLAGRGVTTSNDLLVAYQAILASLDAVWNLHSEMLNMGYAAYLNFLTICRSHFPEITDQAIAKMVSGIDVILFRPDDELKRLARLALELGVADIVAAQEDFADLTAALTASAAGQSWLDGWAESADPWFNFSNGNGFYHHHGSWSDDPSFPLAGVRDYIARLRAGEEIDRPVQAVSDERDSVSAHYRDLVPADERDAFDDALGLSRVVFPYVENHNFYIEHWYMTIFWRKMRELSALFVRFGFIDQVDDLFFLRRSEIADAVADLQFSWCSGGEAIGPVYWPPIVAKRRSVLRVLAHWAPPPALGPAPAAIVEPMTMMLWGITDEQVQKWLAAADGDGRTLNGFAGSPGIAEGPARVVMSPSDLDDLVAGEILVAPITSPSWTPVFARIIGAVSDIGGIMCHAAIVSREYGLPAVVGTGNATSMIRTGQRIRVDGDTGSVTILD
jgi:pyruvate, water dikinase